MGVLNLGSTIFEVFNRFQNDSIWYLNLSSKGIALGNLSEYKLKIGSTINHIYNFAVVKSEAGFQIIILSSKNDSELKEDLLLKLLRNQTSNSLLGIVS